MPRTAVLIVAAGKGERTGRAGPKQYESVAGKPLLRWSAEAFAGLPVTVVIGLASKTIMPQLCPVGLNPFPVAPGGRIRCVWGWRRSNRPGRILS